MIERYVAAVCVVLLWLGLCLRAWHRHRQHQRQTTMAASAVANMTATANEQIIVAYASQTGFAQEVAARTQQSLHASGLAALLLPLSSLTASLLSQPARILFVVSTTGEGDAPDDAAIFISRFMGQSAPESIIDGPAPPFSRLRYAMLALGDSSYAHFCRFGRTLDDWLQRHGAAPLFERIDVDASSTQALNKWQRHIGRAFGITRPARWQAREYQNWILAQRDLLNPGSPGAPCYHLTLKPPQDMSCDWQAGDIAEINIPAPGGQSIAREYSIASTPSEGAIQLLVRQAQYADGRHGVGSGWLTAGAAIGGPVALRIRSSRNFHAPDKRHGLILIGNGTGLAGLRAHLKARSEAGAHENWLIFGERTRAHDYHLRNDIESWQRGGILRRLDLAFSRDQDERIYVQHCLRASAAMVRAWVDQDAAIYVCGSLNGMAADVHQTLADILGSGTFEALIEAGRYRRDVY